MSKACDNDFELWWCGEDDKFRDGLCKKDAKRVWGAGFKAGGAQPWWTINQEQLAVLNKHFKENK